MPFVETVSGVVLSNVRLVFDIRLSQSCSLTETDLSESGFKSTLHICVPPRQRLSAQAVFIAIVSLSSYPIHWSSQVICLIIISGISSGVRPFSLMMASISWMERTPTLAVQGLYTHTLAQQPNDSNECNLPRKVSGSIWATDLGTGRIRECISATIICYSQVDLSRINTIEPNG
jgi:hypothetical protein